MSIKYGSLENVERDEHGIKEAAIAIKKIQARGLLLEDISIPTVNTTQQQELLEKFIKSKQLLQIPLPTQDDKVRKKLQQFSEPQCLFGEGPAERRDRLRTLSQLWAEHGDVLTEDEEEEEEDDDEEFLFILLI